MQPIAAVIAGIAFGVASLAAQQITVPSVFAATEGGTSGNVWRAGINRVQCFYDTLNFTAYCAQEPITISAVAFRLAGGLAANIVTYPSVDIHLQNAAVDFLAPSTTFATNRSTPLGTPNYSGPVTTVSVSGSTPNDFFIRIQLTTPFTYRPQSGQDLLMEIVINAPPTPLLGNTTNTGFSAAAHFANSVRSVNSTTALTGAVSAFCPVVRFTVAPTPGGNSGVSAIAGTNIPTQSPPNPITAHACAELPSGGLLLFGGTTSNGPNLKTYTLSGTAWSEQFPPISPVTRTEHSLLFDSARQNNLLFAGKNPLGTPLADTWTWANNQWNLIPTTTAPAARSSHRMAFDRNANLALLFGGEDAAGAALNDFWSWDGTNWTQVTPATTPPARARHGMAFDALRNRTIVYGGRNGASRLDDVWEWDGAQWTAASTAIHPSERHGSSMIYDTARNRMTLFGGRDTAQFFSDTWDLANNPGPINPGLAWSRRTTTNSPTPRNSQAMAFDATRGETVIFGGYDGTNVGETWTFDGVNWTQRNPAIQPTPRNGPVMCYDAARSRVVMFGGFNMTQFAINETWEWDGTNWSLANPANRPTSRMFGVFSYDSVRQRCVLYGGLGNGGIDLGDTWEYDGSTWTQVATTGPSARRTATMCFDPLRNETVLFGGGSTGPANAETWTWNGSTWTQRNPATSPTPRFPGPMAFDPARGKAVMFGGSNATFSVNYSDTWEWDGFNWNITPLARADCKWIPTARNDHSMAYDERAERVVMYGGESASGCQQDVWSWDGTEWTIHLSQSGSMPSARTNSQMFYDKVTSRLLLFAGGCVTNYTNDLWQLSLPTIARANSYGMPCVGSRGPLTLAVVNNSLPIIGQTFRMQMTNVPVFSPCAGYLGFSNTLFNGVPLPFALDFLSMPGCTAYMSANHNFPLPPPNNITNTTTWDLAIPMDPVFLSLHIYMQGLALEFGGTRFASVTNGIDARIGDR